MPATPLVQEILALKAERGAAILAHNYQRPEIQDLADVVADSLKLARSANGIAADVIVLCGVHFMAETAAIANPGKKVLIPDLEAGCSLAATIQAEDVRAWRAEHPDGVVVAYVNTSAAVKSECDYCCTSGNAVAVIKALPPAVPVLFLPDFFLGNYLRQVTGREMDVWLGECHVHAGLTPDAVAAKRRTMQDAEFLVHPECGCVSNTLYSIAAGDIPRDRTHIVSTEQMMDRARQSPARRFVAATETGVYYSDDDGANWRSLQGNLPVTPVTGERRDEGVVCAHYPRDGDPDPRRRGVCAHARTAVDAGGDQSRISLRPGQTRPSPVTGHWAELVDRRAVWHRHDGSRSARRLRQTDRQNLLCLELHG